MNRGRPDAQLNELSPQYVRYALWTIGELKYSNDGMRVPSLLASVFNRPLANCFTA